MRLIYFDCHVKQNSHRFHSLWLSLSPPSPNAFYAFDREGGGTGGEGGGEGGRSDSRSEKDGVVLRKLVAVIGLRHKSNGVSVVGKAGHSNK